MRRYLMAFLGLMLVLAPLAAFATDCVDISAELAPATGPDSSGLRWVKFSLELTNCGTEPGLVDLSAELQVTPPVTIPRFRFSYPVRAGKTVAFSRTFPVPRIVPEGTYTICFVATLRTASDTSCASITLGPPGPPHVSSTLGQNYPNPFNLETAIRFTISQHTNVSLKVFNIMGQEVRTLANNVYDPGEYFIDWDARDSHGTVVPSGMYFYRLTTDDGVETRKMNLLK